MNILFVASWYPSKLNPKDGNFIEQHALAVKSVGCNVVVVHLMYSNRIFIPGVKRVIQNNIPVYFISIPRLLRNSTRMQAIMYKRIIKRLKGSEFLPEIIHGHVVYPAGELALHLKNHFQVPLVFTEHWSGYKSVNSDLFTEDVKSKTKEVLDETELILPVSHDLAESMVSKGYSGNYAVVNNTVNTSVFYPKPLIQSEVFRFLHISNFEPRAKNTEGIIRAFIEGSFENATLTIAGDGDIEKMRAYAKSLDGDISRIIFMGSLEYTEVADLMRSSHCFILFSNFENLPCVIAESHCCGLPVLATNVGGIPEMIDDSNGILIPPDEEGKLITAMHMMIGNRNRFNQREIANVASIRYSYEAIGLTFLNHYKAILKD